MGGARQRDLVIVGGGPAGLALAIAAARRGLAVRVCELREPPLDKACGEGLLGAGVESLSRLLGADPRPLGHRIAGILYTDGHRSVRAAFPAGREGVGIRRTRLHEALAAAAGAAGAELVWRCRVEGLTAQGVLVDGQELPCRFVAGADGLRSRVREWAGLAGPAAPRRRYGLRRHYQLPPWSDEVEVHWSPRVEGGEAYVTPVAADCVGVALLWQGQRPRGTALAETFPQLAARLAGAPLASRERGSGPFAQNVRGILAGRVALIGDAAGYVDALTGEGLGLAFREAEALAQALAAGRPATYPAASRHIRRHPERLTRLLVAAASRPRLRRHVVPTLAALPGLYRWQLGRL